MTNWANLVDSIPITVVPGFLLIFIVAAKFALGIDFVAMVGLPAAMVAGVGTFVFTFIRGRKFMSR
jgi:LytS/YehU family sensor histidine kinase